MSVGHVSATFKVDVSDADISTQPQLLMGGTATGHAAGYKRKRAASCASQQYQYECFCGERIRGHLLPLATSVETLFWH